MTQPAGLTSPVTVLMIVDNTVDGDSRVQKSARGAAALGFDVTLLGRSPGRSADQRPLGAALQRRVPTPFTREKQRRDRLKRWERLRSAPSQILRHGVQRLPGPAGGTGRAAPPQPLGRGLAWVDAIRGRFWRLVSGTACWARLEPRLMDYETAFWPVISAAEPDILHAHDYKMVGIAVRAARRLRARGHQTRVVYDAHEFLPGVPGPSKRWQIAYEAYEAAHIRQADAVVAVSDRLAQLLMDRYDLPVLPTVVMNAPEIDATDDPTDDQTDDPSAHAGDLRTALGLAPQVPLLVYSGVTAPRRGLSTVVEALAQLPGVHLALVTTRNVYVDGLLAQASELGVADRVHVHDYVPQQHVVAFLRTATAGVIPIHHTLNHEIALITKYFEYAHSHLPILTSDVETMARQTRELGNGEVFRAQDVPDFVRACRAVLADPATYTKTYEAHVDLLQTWTWHRQAATLAELYRRLMRTAPAAPTTGARP